MLLRLIIKSVTTLAESTLVVASGCLFSLQAVNISAAANPKKIFFILLMIKLIFLLVYTHVALLVFIHVALLVYTVQR